MQIVPKVTKQRASCFVRDAGAAVLCSVAVAEKAENDADVELRAAALSGADYAALAGVAARMLRGPLAKTKVVVDIAVVGSADAFAACVNAVAFCLALRGVPLADSFACASAGAATVVVGAFSRRALFVRCSGSVSAVGDAVRACDAAFAEIAAAWEKFVD